MKITFTENAIKKIEELLNHKENLYLKLKYDTDNCGCEGIPKLWVVETIDEEENIVETNFLPVQLEKWSMYFWDEEMTIHYDEVYHSFQLKSPGQMINPRLKVQLIV